MILGTVELGLDYGINNSEGKPSKMQAFELLDTAWNGGIRELDTAAAYGDSEYIIGQYQKETGHMFQIDTKLPVGVAEEKYLSSFKLSCEKLGIPKINLLYLHSFEQCKNDKLLSFLLSLKENRKIKHIGISIYEPDEMKYILKKLPFVDTIQFPFSLLDNARWKRDGLLELAVSSKKRLYVRSIFLQGLFFKMPNDLFVQSLAAEKYISKIRDLANTANMTIAELAYKFVAENDMITEIIIGCQKSSEVKSNLKLMNSNALLPKEVIECLEALSKDVSLNIIDPRRWKR